MKNDIVYGAEKHCYQWMYAQKTKDIVDKIKVLNLNLRNIQKEGKCLDQTKSLIDEILFLEKINFNNIMNIFNIKLNFLHYFQAGLLDLNVPTTNDETLNNSSDEESSIKPNKSKF